MTRSFYIASVIILLLSCNAREGKKIDEKMILLDREKFSLQYPSSWKIDSTDEDYDPDALFSIDAPDEGSSVMFLFMDMELDPDDLLDEEELIIKKPTSVSEFNTWGNISGKGKMIKGKIAGIFKGQVNMFVSNYEDKTLFLMEQYHDNDADLVKPIFRQIASSFKLKKRSE